MAGEVIFHRLVQKDMTDIRGYYLEEAGLELADRFYDGFMQTVVKAVSNPRHYHPIEEGQNVRRATVKGFPYHFLYRETSFGIRVLVLRHDKRHWSFGLRRK
jgi:plasmid stabilization system protein ParE